MLINEDHARHPIVRRQVVSMRKAGYEVTVLQPGPSMARTPYQVVRVPPATLDRVADGVWRVLRRVAGQRWSEVWWTVVYFTGLLASAARTARAAVQQQTDVYQAHDLASLLASLIAGKIRRRAVVYDAHELTSEQGDPRRLRNRGERILERWLVPRVDYLVVPNGSRGQVYMERYGLRRPFTVVLNCPPTFTAVPSRIIHQRLRLPAAMRVVLYHGTLMAGRALEQLVCSSRFYDPGTVLVVIGNQDTFYRDVLEPIVKREHLDRVYFLPFVQPDEVLAYVAAADLGVVIYRNTNLNNYLCAPTKLYELIMAGVPVVASNFPEIRELLSAYPVGTTFDPEDPRSIASAVNTALQGSDAARERMAAAFEAARNRFTWERESEKLVSVLGDAAQNRGRDRRRQRAFIE